MSNFDGVFSRWQVWTVIRDSMRAGNPVNRIAVISSFQVDVMSHLGGESDWNLMFTLTYLDSTLQVNKLMFSWLGIRIRALSPCPMDTVHSKIVLWYYSTVSSKGLKYQPEKMPICQAWEYSITGFISSWATTCHPHSFELHALARGWSRSWSSCWRWQCCPPSHTSPASWGCSSETPPLTPQPFLLSLSHDFPQGGNPLPQAMFHKKLG